MNKNILYKAIAILLPSIVFLLLAEWMIRWMVHSENPAFEGLKDAALFGETIDHKDGKFFLTDYWKLTHEFNGGMNVEDPDSILGWTNSQNFSDKIKFHLKLCGNRTPVLFYGDSFAQCVDTTTCFDEHLNNDPEFAKDHYFVNLGVGGYGVDQIYLMMKNTVKEFNDPIIIYSFLTTDMDRSMLSFRDAQKPFFQINESGELELQGVPIEMNTKSYLEKYPADIPSYIVRLLKNSKMNFLRDDEADAKDYIDKEKQLNKVLIEKSIDYARENSKRHLAFLFAPAHHNISDWRFLFSRGIFEDSKMPYMCELDIMYDHEHNDFFNVDDYIIKGDGHPTSFMNYLIAQELKNFVLHDSSKYIRPSPEEFYSEDVLIPTSIYQKLERRKKAQN